MIWIGIGVGILVAVPVTAFVIYVLIARTMWNAWRR